MEETLGVVRVEVGEHVARQPMETERHAVQYAHLITTLTHAMRERDDVYVAGNMFVCFSPRQLKNQHFRGPDVFVVVGAEKKECEPQPSQRAIHVACR